MYKTVFKVVTEFEGQYYSCRTGGDTHYALQSMLVNNSPQVLRYYLNGVTKPNFGYIFAFNSLLSAVRFVEMFKVVIETSLTLRIMRGVGDAIDDHDEFNNIIKYKLSMCNSEVSIMINGWHKECNRANITICGGVPQDTVFLRDFRGEELLPLSEEKD